AASFAAADPESVAGQAGPSCSSHASLTQPPESIRVLHRRTGRIEEVNFRKYVVTVMGKEWPSYLPFPVVQAGAVAVKQYAWYHAVYSSRSSGGRCFDVRDGTSDQLYKPDRARIRPDHYRALDSTWDVTLRKDGRLFMTGYRRGYKVSCGRDATGYKLFARSATQCAYKGVGWQQILRTYYGPGVELVSSRASESTAGAPPPVLPKSVAGSSAMRLSNGLWVDSSATDVVGGSGFFGSTTGGLAAALEKAAVPVP
ncbi:MAG: SpoIID/LytB domain-containing protein, partial [Candidatus Limnocylindrales bacterium]